MKSVPTHVLFLCTGNSARSILSEAILTDLGGKRFRAFSAGSHPSPAPHPDGLAELKRRGHRLRHYRSKSWDEFSPALHQTAAQSTPPLQMDIIITVCDHAAQHSCPLFVGQGIKLHWPAPDPADIERDIPNSAARRQSFYKTYDLCRARIETLIRFPPADLTDHARLQSIARVTA